jgi:hypothetical protein
MWGEVKGILEQNGDCLLFFGSAAEKKLTVSGLLWEFHGLALLGEQEEFGALSPQLVTNSRKSTSTTSP